MVAGFTGIVVADSPGMDRIVRQRTKASRKRGAKSSPDQLPDQQSDQSSKRRLRIEAAIRRIPQGKVSTYGAVARAAGFPGAARQVAKVLHRGFGLPWQRVLGAGGEIKLRGDSAIEQRLRLEAEGVRFRGRKADMKQCEYKFGRATKKR
jgi:methylated-DNA-protein-cysteine methyltransferase related protein